MFLLYVSLRHYTCVSSIRSRNLSIQTLGNISVLRGKSAAIIVFKRNTLINNNQLVFYMFLLRHYTCVSAIGSRNLSFDHGAPAPIDRPAD